MRLFLFMYSLLTRGSNEIELVWFKHCVDCPETEAQRETGWLKHSWGISVLKEKRMLSFILNTNHFSIKVRPGHVYTSSMCWLSALLKLPPLHLPCSEPWTMCPCMEPDNPVSLIITKGRITNKIKPFLPHMTDGVWSTGLSCHLQLLFWKPL